MHIVPPGQSASAMQLSEQKRKVPPGPMMHADGEGSSLQSPVPMGQAHIWQTPAKQRVPGFRRPQSSFEVQFDTWHCCSER